MVASHSGTQIKRLIPDLGFVEPVSEKIPVLHPTTSGVSPEIHTDSAPDLGKLELPPSMYPLPVSPPIDLAHFYLGPEFQASPNQFNAATSETVQPPTFTGEQYHQFFQQEAPNQFHAATSETMQLPTFADGQYQQLLWQYAAQHHNSVCLAPLPNLNAVFLAPQPHMQLPNKLDTVLLAPQPNLDLVFSVPYLQPPNPVFSATQSHPQLPNQ